MEKPKKVAYVRIKSRNGNSSSKRLILPLIIGGHGNCDIIVHSSVFDERELVLQNKSAQLVLVNSKGFCIKEGKQLKKFFKTFNLSITGPFRGYPESNKLKNYFKELLEKERILIKKSPESIGMILGSKFKQRDRFLYYIFSIAIIYLSFLSLEKNLPKTALTKLYEVPIEIGRPIFATLGSDPSHPLMASGFELLAKNSLPEANEALFLKFEYRGLTQQQDFTLTWGEKKIFRPLDDLSCLNSYCTAALILPQEVHKLTEIRIKFLKGEPDLPYRVRNIEISPVEVLSQEKIALCEIWLATAKRYYEERQISHANLINAQVYIRKLEEILSTSIGQINMKANVSDLKSQIQNTWQSSINALEFEGKRQLIFGQTTEARQTYENLLKFYSNGNQTARQRIHQILRGIADEKKGKG